MTIEDTGQTGQISGSGQAKSRLRALFGGNRTDGAAEAMTRLLDASPVAMAVFSATGEPCYMNPAYDQLDLPPGSEVRSQHDESETGRLSVVDSRRDEITIEIVELGDGFGIVAEPSKGRWEIRDKALTYLLDPTFADEDLYTRAARALGRASGWRWIGISRFLDPEGANVQVLGWWDAAKTGDGYDLSTIGSACEIVNRSHQFCLYVGHDDLTERFPNWGNVEALGLEAYAGLSYRIDGRPAGHIMALHDDADVAGDIIEDLFKLFTSYIGTSLELEEQRDLASEEARLARSDVATGLGNRRSFDEKVSELTQAQESGQDPAELLVVYADLDGLKYINDHFGHEVGDSLIAAYGEVMRKMWRPTDYLFRVGGDEFVALIPGLGPEDTAVIEERLERGTSDLLKAVQGLDIGDSETVGGVSHGLAFLSQHHDVHEACAVADQKMYESKRHRARSTSAAIDGD